MFKLNNTVIKPTIFPDGTSQIWKLPDALLKSDTIPSIEGVVRYYNGKLDKELIGTSIPATEHSVQCAYGDDMEYYKNIISKVHPNGFVSIVSDGCDFWDVMGRVIPALKDLILARDGKVVVRPDSGDQLVEVFRDGNLLVDQSFSEIRARIASSNK